MGKCHYFLATDGSQKFEFCAFRSVRQILLSNYRSVVTGHWKGWKTEQGADGKTKFVAQEYENGDECPGFGKRYTLVEYTCKKEAKGLELVSIAEYGASWRAGWLWLGGAQLRRRARNRLSPFPLSSRRPLQTFASTG